MWGIDSHPRHDTAPSFKSLDLGESMLGLGSGSTVDGNAVIQGTEGVGRRQLNQRHWEAEERVPPCSIKVKEVRLVLNRHWSGNSGTRNSCISRGRTPDPSSTKNISCLYNCCQRTQSDQPPLFHLSSYYNFIGAFSFLGLYLYV